MHEIKSASAAKVKSENEKKPRKLKRFIAENKRDFIILSVCAVLSVAVWIVSSFVLGHGEDLSAIGEKVFPQTVFYLFGNQSFPISESVVSGWIATGLIIALALLFRIFIVPRMKFIPGKIQYITEALIGTFDGMSSKNGHVKSLGPIIFAFASFICVGTLLEMVGIRPPNADINTCIAMALCTFFLMNFYGLKRKGPIGRLKRYLKNPINIISDLAVPVSMTFRLFGSILSGALLMALLYAVLPPVLPAFMSVLATLMHAFIQAFIFATLTSIFVGEAVE